MSMRVTQKSMHNAVVSQMQRNLSAYMESNQQGSTQKKINRPADDPAGTYRVLMTRNDIDATKQYQSNVDTAKGWLNLADEVLGTKLSTVITRARTLAEQASSGTYTAENRRQIAFEVREIFGSVLNMSNTEFEGKSIFGGQRYDRNAFEQGLALTSWDKTWDAAIQAGEYRVEGASNSTMMIQFTSTGELGTDALTYRWSRDGGATWHDDTVAAGSTTLVADGVTVVMQNKLAVSAADVSLGPGANNGTLLYVRPAAFYQGDDNDPPADMTIMGGPPGLTSSASGEFGSNLLVRLDTDADLSAAGNAFTYSYSLDAGSTWVTATAESGAGNKVRLPVPGGYVDLDAAGVAGNMVDAGTQVLVHPSRADLDLEIMKGSYIAVNNVGKDIFGGYYEGKPARNLEKNLFEVLGNFVAYCENNNQQGCQQVLEQLGSVQQGILTEVARIGGLENRLNTAADVLSFLKLDQQERLSYVEDIDLTELLNKLARQQLTYQTVLQSSSRIMQMSLSNYL